MSKKEKGTEKDDFALEDEIKELEAESSPKSSRFDDAKRKVAAASKKKREIDPIIAVSAVVLILACAIVLVNATYDMHFSGDRGPAVEYGNTVTVDYIGCYNGYYDESGNARVFDTTLKSVDTDSKTVKSWEYSSKSFNKIEVTVGSGKYLAMFENALIGHHRGDTVKVMIPASEGYGEIPASQILEYTGNGYVQISTLMTSGDFESLFGQAAPAVGVLYLKQCFPDANGEEEKKNEPSTPYGFGATVISNVDGTVTVQYDCEIGTKYKMNDDINVIVTDIKDGKIYYDYELVNVGFSGMIRIYQDNVRMYLCIEDGATYVKTCEERVGEVLYFTITIGDFVKEKS